MASAPLGSNNVVLEDLISRYTGASGTAIPRDVLFGDIGLDSIAAVQLADELTTRFKLQIHPDELFGVSLGILVKYLQGSRPAAAISRAVSPTKQHPSIKEDAAKTGSVSESQHQDGSLPNPFIALRQSDAQFENTTRKSGFCGYWENVAPLQNDLLLAYITEAFHSLGVDLSEYSHGTEIPSLAHIPKYDRLMKRLLDILESRYIVMQRAGKVLRGSDKIDVNPSSELCQVLRTLHPQFECEAKLLALIGTKLADCISGNTDPVSVLFGSASSLKIMEDFYAKAPMMSTLTDQLVAFLIAVLRSAPYSHEYPARILEVGAGTGGTTARLAEALAAAGIAVEYMFTDVGPAFVTKAKARFGKRYPWMKFEVLNLEQEMPAAFRSRYYITLGANVVHATSNRITSCRRLRETLRSGGFVVLSEVTRVIGWYDICFGLLDGWWVSESGKGYPIQPADTWMDAFNRAGYSSMGFSTGPTEEANSQQLLVACNKEWDVPPSTAM